MKKIISILSKYHCLTVIFCFIYGNSYSQYNLVNNPSFEDYLTCPTQSNRFPPIKWYMTGTQKELIYSNSCDTGVFASVPFNYSKGFSYQYARTGLGYVLSDYVNIPNSNRRTYIQTKLNDSLRKDKLYYVEHFVNSPNSQKLACNNVGALLTKTAFYQDTTLQPYQVLPANPHILNYGNPIIADTINWIKVSGVFKAQGGEQYLTLGNFKYDNQTSYTQFLPTGYACAGYYIDDVSVIPLDSMCLKADAGNDTAITVGDSVFIGSYTNGLDNVKWFNNNAVIDSTRPGFWVHPTATTSYILQQVVNGCFSADTVVITVGTVPLKFTNYELRFTNETRNGINEKQVTNNWTTANEINVSHFNIQRSLNGRDFINIGKVVANNKSLNDYRYTDNRLPLTVDGSLNYRIESIDFDGRKQYSTIQQITIKPQKPNIVIFPNPAKDFVTISSNQNIKSLKLINLYGQVIQEYSSINSNSYQIKISTLTSGVYWLKTSLKDGTQQTQKLLIEHKN